MSGTAPVTFGGSSSGGAQIPGPAYESQPVAPFPNYVTGQAADGTRYIYKMASVTLSQWELSFRHLTSAEKDDLDAFYEDMEGPVQTFIYVHTNGESYTARFVQESLPWVRNGQNWDVVIVLETADSIV